MTINQPITSLELTDVQLYSEDGNNSKIWFLNLTYKFKNKDGIFNIVFPKVLLPIHHSPIINQETDHFKTLTYLDFGNDWILPVLPEKDNDNICFTINTLEQKLTIAEIEKQLGYKVQIISEKEGE